MYSNDYQLSTSIKYLQDTDSKLVKFVIGTLSTVSFYINRSTLWGIFFSRYNPSQLELFFGTGPFNLSKHYSEINLKTPKIFKKVTPPPAVVAPTKAEVSQATSIAPQDMQSSSADNRINDSTGIRHKVSVSRE